MPNNLYARIASVMTSHRDRLCFEIPGAVDWSYGDLLSCVELLSGALAQSGVIPGARVLVQVPKSPEAVALYLATLRVGAIFVPINSSYTDAEVAYFIEDATPCLFVSAPDRKSPVPVAAQLSLDAQGGGSLMSLAADAAPVAAAAGSWNDLAAIVYTSGTTGRSKGAMLTHGNLLSNADTLRSLWGWQEDDVLLHALPIFHVHGLFVALHAALLTGTPMIWLTSFSAAAVSAMIPRSTVLMGVPTFYTRLLEYQRFTKETCKNIRLFISGSAPLTEQTFNAFEQRTGHRILERYGMSETIMLSSNPLCGERRAGTVGFALPDVSLRIADDSGVALPTGAVGIIEVKGPNVFAGYWQMPEKTALEFRPDGYFITGDMAVMAEDGRLSIVGREKDLVISGGYNVYPKEIERLIDDLPGIAESAVIGVPHPDLGEGVVALLVRDHEQETELDEGVLRELLSVSLARFKLPKRLIYVETLPRNSMGKVQKNLLRQQFSDLLLE